MDLGDAFQERHFQCWIFVIVDDVGPDDIRTAVKSQNFGEDFVGHDQFALGADNIDA